MPGMCVKPGRVRLPPTLAGALTGVALGTDTKREILCSGSLSICDSIARTAAFACADGGRIQRR
jgi:hypothetical protein